MPCLVRSLRPALCSSVTIVATTRPCNARGIDDVRRSSHRAHGVGLLAKAGGLLLLVGFVAQLPQVRSYGWLAPVRGYTDPIARIVRNYVPTVFGGVDWALVVALGVLVVVYTMVQRALLVVEATARPSAAPIPKQVAASPRTSTPAAEANPPTYLSEALLVIDLVNSSELVSRFGNSFFFSLKRRMEQLAMPLATRHGVSYSENTGDGFLFCFPSVAEAAGTVKEIFGALPRLNEDLPEGAEVALRGAVNFGEVIVSGSDGNRTGSAVHKTFRLQGVLPTSVFAAPGGVGAEEVPEKNCVFISEEALSGVEKLPEFQCRFLGLTELKGLPSLHRVYHLQWSGPP
jgi:class 3 adenylate cyclase